MFKRIDDWVWNHQVKKRFGIPHAIHMVVKTDECQMVLWHEDDVPELFARPNDISLHEKLIAEWKQAARNTVAKPLKYIRKFNIITNDGISDISKNRTGETTNTNLWYLYGDASSPAEDLGDHALNNKVFGASFASKGSRASINGTEKYLMPILYTDYVGAIREAGLATGPTPPTDILLTHYTFPLVTIATSTLLTALTTITNRNGIS